MDYKCVKQRDSLPDMEEFKKVAQPLIVWVNANCGPHEKVVVEMGKVTLIGDEMGFTTEIPD
ncbi:hypothetical protein [uncultured Bacteroides sp.]|uniref:hypothetical protein n=1 Tax=uncultured Bacteroides sp. TaxID=162156 RepID=UPI0025995971|nr:hypothetical protein [uncultured Bacteroides sp.]